MEKIIQASEATITETTVDVQVIRIGRKQMTLAVFRQLWEHECMTYHDYDHEEIWGYVNYCTHSCHKRSPHYHILCTEACGDLCVKIFYKPLINIDDSNGIVNTALDLYFNAGGVFGYKKGILRIPAKHFNDTVSKENNSIICKFRNAIKRMPYYTGTKTARYTGDNEENPVYCYMIDVTHQDSPVILDSADNIALKLNSTQSMSSIHYYDSNGDKQMFENDVDYDEQLKLYEMLDDFLTQLFIAV